MKTNEPGIEKLEGKKGTIYRVQIRKKGFKHQSRSFTTFKAAKQWKYGIIKAQTSGEVTDTALMRLFASSVRRVDFPLQSILKSRQSYFCREDKLYYLSTHFPKLAQEHLCS